MKETFLSNKMRKSDEGLEAARDIRRVSHAEKPSSGMFRMPPSPAKAGEGIAPLPHAAAACFNSPIVARIASANAAASWD